MKPLPKLRSLLRRSRRGLAAVLVVSVLVQSSVAALAIFSPQPAYAASANEEQQQAILSGISNVIELKKTFGLQESKTGGDNHIDFNIHWNHDNVRNQGFEPRENTYGPLKAFRGNPWLEWTNSEPRRTDNQEIPRGSGLSVRFVLSGATFRTAGIEGGAGLQSEGIVWIFTNEYNSQLKVILWSRGGGGITGPVGGGGDYDRFVYAKDCYQVTSEDDAIYMANVKFHAANFDRGSVLPDNPDGDEAKKRLKDYKIDNPCHVSTGTFAKAIKNAIKGLAEALGGLLTAITGWLGDIMDVGTLASVRGITQAWKTMRDFVNLVFILVLVTIAFSNILRLDTERYGVRSLLPRLIFAVIAVNFSLLMVQILTNVAFILAQPFKETAVLLLTDPPVNSSLINPDGGIGKAVVAALVILGVILALLVLLVILVVRIVIIWLLGVLSPFVFLFMILPVTRSLASMWWKNALKWIFMAPIAFVILYIAATVLSSGAQPNVSNTEDPGFILKVGFFIGAVIAAVIIPLKLGGEILQRAGQIGRGAARRGARLGGGAGLGLLGEADKRLGTKMAANVEGYAIKRGWRKPPPAGSAGRARYEAAAEHLQEKVGKGEGIGRFGPYTPTRRSRALQAAIREAAPALNRYNPESQMRMVGAHAAGGFALGSDGQYYPLKMDHASRAGEDKLNKQYGGMTAEEQELSKQHIPMLAAGQILSEATNLPDEVKPYFAKDGITQLNRGDPIDQAMRPDGQISYGAAENIAKLTGRNDAGKLDHSFWKNAEETTRILSQADPRTGKTYLDTYKDLSKPGERRAYIAELAEKGITDRSKKLKLNHAHAAAFHAFQHLGGAEGASMIRSLVQRGDRDAASTPAKRTAIARTVAMGGYVNANKDTNQEILETFSSTHGASAEDTIKNIEGMDPGLEHRIDRTLPRKPK